MTSPLIKLCWIIVALAICSPSYAEVIIFIGNPLAVAASDRSCTEFINTDPGAEVEKICMDGVFLLRYEIEELYLGEPSNDQIEFYGFYHYAGMPNYTVAPELFFVVKEINDEYITHRWDYVTWTDAGWWICEDNAYFDGETEECSIGRLAEEIASDYEKSINQSNKAQPSAAGTH